MKIFKYLTVFKTSFEQEFIYPINFVFWRLRNIIRFLLLYFLWSTVYLDSGKMIFGYDRARILTYVFVAFFLRAIVFSSKSADIAGEIQNGGLSNYLLKPINYFLYWLTRDFASKFLNVLFAIIETAILFLILRPQFYFPSNPYQILMFILFVLIAIALYSLITFLIALIPFWMPEAGWGSLFFVTIIIEFLSGSNFPLDVFPGVVQDILYLTPFPYLLFFPVEIFLGKISGIFLLRAVIICSFWLLGFWYLLTVVWKKGLKQYESWGR